VGQAVDEPHAQVSKNALEVVLGIVVGEMDGGGEDRSVAILEGVFKAVLEDEFDETLVMGRYQTVVDRKDPEDHIGLSQFIQEGLELVRPLFVILEMPDQVDDLEVVGRMTVDQVVDGLQGGTLLAFGTAAEDKNFHGRLLSWFDEVIILWKGLLRNVFGTRCSQEGGRDSFKGVIVLLSVDVFS